MAMRLIILFLIFIHTITPTVILLFVSISSYFVVPVPFDVVGLTFEVYSGENQLCSGQDLVGPGFFCCDEFSSPRNKKNKAADSNKGIFEKFLKFWHTSRKKKNLSHHI